VSRLAIGTIVARNYLAHARVLAHSLRRHHPEIPFYVLFADATDSERDGGDEPFQLLSIADLDLDDVRSLLFRYECKPALIALKPTLLRHLLGAGYPSVLLLDADMLVQRSIQEALDHVSSHALTLSPHVGMAPTNADRLARERLLLMVGIYNGGFVGASDRPETHRFLEWWETRLSRHCDDNVREGFHFDQRWLDLAPGFIDDLHILRDPGINVAYWNLPDLELQLDDDRLLVNGQTCRLFHFSGFDPDDPGKASRYAPDLTTEELGPAAVVFRQYRQMLKDAGHDQTKDAPWPWDRFVNGVEIAPSARQAFRAMGDESRRFSDPFDVRRRSFYRLLNGQASSWARCRRALRARVPRLRRTPETQKPPEP